MLNRYHARAKVAEKALADAQAEIARLREIEAAPAPAEDGPSWCPTCEVHVVAYSTFTDDKTGWRCCSACTTALTAGPSAPAPAREQADPADEGGDRG